MIVGIDAGNHEVKVCGPAGVDRFSSAIGEYRERNIKDKHGNDDIVFEFKGRKGFAGSLAKAESEFGGSIMGETKAHPDTLLRVLIALHRHGSMVNNYKIVVGQPIGRHNEEEKQRIKEMLTGTHEIKLNGFKKVIKISNVEVAAEGAAGFWSRPYNNKIRLIDIGSGTVNCATLDNKKYIDKDSFTLPFGADSVKTRDFGAMARGIMTQTSKKWNTYDHVFILGGAAQDLLPYMQEYYPKSKLLIPLNDQNEALHPVFANALGFYYIGTMIYD